MDIDFIHSYAVPEIDSRFMKIYEEYASDIDKQSNAKKMFHVNVGR